MSLWFCQLWRLSFFSIAHQGAGRPSSARLSDRCLGRVRGLSLIHIFLQSRPEERRSLIEEAAGISKHKRRKERALRKIKSMDEHLTRARDINREISRQLKPLERQVDRARKYKDCLLYTSRCV